jgi:hypothetical protein
MSDKNTEELSEQISKEVLEELEQAIDNKQIKAISEYLSKGIDKALKGSFQIKNISNNIEIKFEKISVTEKLRKKIEEKRRELYKKLNNLYINKKIINSPSFQEEKQKLISHFEIVNIHTYVIKENKEEYVLFNKENFKVQFLVAYNKFFQELCNDTEEFFVDNRGVSYVKIYDYFSKEKNIRNIEEAYEEFAEIIKRIKISIDSHNREVKEVIDSYFQAISYRKDAI